MFPSARGPAPAASSGRVLLVAHTKLSWQYVREAYRTLRPDPRLTFAVTQGSDEFGGGVEPTISQVGLPILPWEEAVAERWDLALFGTHGGEIFFRRAATRVHVQHGLGAGKLVAGDDFTYGRSWALWNGRLKYDLMLEASHAVERSAIAACPPLAGVIAVVGDLTADRLLASRALRDEYRAALGVQPGQVAVLFASTWGAHGLLGATGTGLLERALSLPEYAVMLTAHPHVWQGRRGEPPTRWDRRLAPLVERGLTVCGPDEGWVPYLVAADLAVIDHGSLGLYFALLGRPTVRIPVPATEINPRSPIAVLRECSPLLRDPEDLGRVVEHARRAHDPDMVAARCGEIVSYLGEASMRIRAVLYQRLPVLEPTDPAPAAEPAPIPGSSGPNAARG
jgi:hypothetical protein